tara:strand:- start:874 stop:1197 length:324 start_codon:yes stop_codon:yes gene_type:complete
MKKPALRKGRFSKIQFRETEWTKSSKNIGEYIFRRISLDQSSKEIQNIRPRHQMSQLFITSKEINMYVNDYLKMMENKSKNNRNVQTDFKNKTNDSKTILDNHIAHS